MTTHNDDESEPDYPHGWSKHGRYYTDGTVFLKNRLIVEMLACIEFRTQCYVHIAVRVPENTKIVLFTTLGSQKTVILMEFEFDVTNAIFGCPTMIHSCLPFFSIPETIASAPIKKNEKVLCFATFHRPTAEFTFKPFQLQARPFLLDLHGWFLLDQLLLSSTSFRVLLVIIMHHDMHVHTNDCCGLVSLESRCAQRPRLHRPMLEEALGTDTERREHTMLSPLLALTAAHPLLAGHAKIWHRA